MKTNIALIGFMGTGKTSVARVLAARLDKKLVELDALIEQRAGKSITRIFHEDGEATFRQMEKEFAAEAAQGENQVIACGGGVVLNPLSVERIRRSSVVVYLVASLEEILRRVVSDGAVRPLLETEWPARTVGNLMESRRNLYERAADITIDTTDLNIEAVADKIIVELKNVCLS
jgi:shikimate kinase